MSESKEGDTKMNTTMAETLLVKYESEVARLLVLKTRLDVEEARVKWMPLVGLVVGVVVAVAKKPVYGVFPFALSLAMAVTALYLTRVHRMERDYNLARAKREVRRLRAEASPVSAPAAGPRAHPPVERVPSERTDENIGG